MADENFTFKQQIECVEREIALREKMYPMWVDAGKLTPKKSDYEIRCMESVLYTLQSINRQYEEATK
jgi:hypothetical protein